MGSDSYHEPLELLPEEVRNMHRAIVSLCEELEAIDWYHQRAAACSDPDLRAVIEHNRDDEVEHAMMTLEWIRRHNPVFNANIAKYINTEGSITALEKAVKNGSKSTGASAGLGLGSLRGGKR